jgi:hypothetical protein
MITTTSSSSFSPNKARGRGSGGGSGDGPITTSPHQASVVAAGGRGGEKGNHKEGVNRAWELLKFLLKASDVVVSKASLKEIIYVTGETDADLLGKPVQWNDKKRSRLIQTIENQFKGTGESSLSGAVISESLKKIQNEISWVKTQIRDGLEAPSDCALWEYTCAVVSMTLRKDHWYEKGGSSQMRAGEKRPMRKYMWVIFYLRCWYRLWWRKDAIPAERAETPIWGTVEEDYMLGGERVFSMPANETRPIIEWPPATVVSALETLMMGRLVGHCKLQEPAVVCLFEDYRAGLLDRVALIVCQPVAGIPKTIYPLDGRFFKEKIGTSLAGGGGGGATQEKTAAETEEEGLLGQDDRIISVARKIREFKENDTAKRRKLMEIEEIEKPSQAPLSVRLADAKAQNAMMQLNYLRQELFHKKEYLRILINAEAESDQALLPEDAIEKERLLKDITDLENTITRDENVKLLQVQLQIEKEQQKAQEISRRKLIAVSQSECRDLFVEKLSIIVDHIYFWQFPSGGLKIRLFQERHVFIKQCFFDAIVDSAKWTNELTFLENCQQYIVGFDIIFPERESYRMDYPEAKFSALDVCSSRRNIEQTKLEGFPSTNMAELYADKKHPWHSRAWIYIVHHYIVQRYPLIPVDNTIFIFDLEEECCSLNRAELRNPTIGRVAYDWISLRGGAYFTSDDILKGVWCGQDILDCLICWCEMMEEKYPNGEEWMVYDRITAKPYQLTKKGNEMDGVCELFRSSVQRFLSRKVDHGGGGDVEG